MLASSVAQAILKLRAAAPPSGSRPPAVLPSLGRLCGHLVLEVSHFNFSPAPEDLDTTDTFGKLKETRVLSHFRDLAGLPVGVRLILSQVLLWLLDGV